MSYGCVHEWTHKGETFRCGYPTIPPSSFCGLHSLSPTEETPNHEH